jgi:hypothetical protein
MATLQNGRQHDLVVEGVTLKPGMNDVSDEQMVKLGDNGSFRDWVKLGWIGIAKYSEEQLRTLQAEASAKEAAAKAEREAAAAKTAATHEAQVVSTRENGLDAEMRQARERVAAKGPQQGQLPAQGASPPGPSKHATLPHDGSTENTTPPTTGVEGPKAGPLSAQQPGTLEPSKHGTLPHDGTTTPAGQTIGHDGPEGSLKGADVGSSSAQAEARGDVHAKNEQAARDAGAKGGKK